MKILDGTFDTLLGMADMRFFPSIEKLNKKERKSLEQRVENLIEFHSEAKLPFQTVKYIEKHLLNQGFEKRDIFENGLFSGRKYFYIDPWEKSSMIIVREGEKPITEGFRLVNSHADSPCLKIKQRPLRMEEEKMDSFNYLGLRLSVIPHGGIVVPHWIGQQVEVMGYTLNKNNERREIKFPGFVGVNSCHVDYSDYEMVSEAFPPEKSLEIITGYSNIPDFLKRIGLKDMDDFSNTQLWAVPTNKMIPLGENKLNLLVGYGHDDRTGVFSAVNAITKSNNPQYTSIVWVSDNEEIHDPPPSGADGPFFEILINKLIENEERTESRKVAESEKYRMYTNSRAIVGDVTIAPYGHDKKGMDYKSSAKIGLGVAITGNVQGNDPNFIRHLRDISSTKKLVKGISYQLCGEFYDQDIMPVWRVSGGDYKRLRLKGVPEIWVGVPCASCHSAVEAICPGDEYATFQIYKRFFEAKQD